MTVKITTAKTATAKTLSPKSLKLLAWFRDTQHHMATVFPSYSAPGESTHMIIRGDKSQRKIPCTTLNELFPFLKAGDYQKDKRMYVPTPKGLKLLAAAGL